MIQWNTNAVLVVCLPDQRRKLGCYLGTIYDCIPMRGGQAIQCKNKCKISETELLPSINPRRNLIGLSRLQLAEGPNGGPGEHAQRHHVRLHVAVQENNGIALWDYFTLHSCMRCRSRSNNTEPRVYFTTSADASPLFEDVNAQDENTSMPEPARDGIPRLAAVVKL